MKLPIELFKFVKTIPGAISMTEAVGIYNTVITCLKSEKGYAVDLGSFAGKSAAVGAAAVSKVGLVDPFLLVDLVYDLKNPEWKKTSTGSFDHMPFIHEPDFNFIVRARVEKYAPGVAIGLLGLSSAQFFNGAHGRFPYIAYAFIDTDDHNENLVMTEAKHLEDRMLSGGLIFFHDFKNQYVGPAMAYEYLVSTGKYELIQIDWDAAYVIAEKFGLETGNNSWHMPGVAYPAFVGCVRRF